MHLSKYTSFLAGVVLLSSLALNLWFYTRPAPPAPPAPANPGIPSAPPRQPRPAEADTVSTKPLRERLDRALASGSTSAELSPLLAEWTALSPAAALQWVEVHTEGSLQTELLAGALAVWARSAPAAAGEWVRYLPPGATRDQAVFTVLDQWGRSKGADAAAWLDTLSTGPLRLASESHLAAASRLASSWASLQPAEAVAWSRDFVRTHAGSDAFHLALAAWGRSDAPSATAYYQSLPEGETRAIAAESIARGMAQTNPSAAIDWALGLGADEPGWQARNAVIDQWSADRPSQVADRLAAITDDDERTHHIETLMRHWTATNADAAELWTLKLPPGIDKNHALKGLAENYAPSSPAKALNLGITIADPALRNQVTEGILSWWREEDRAQADAWLTATPLDPALKTFLSRQESEEPASPEK